MGVRRRLKEPVKADPIVWMEARKHLSQRKNKRSTRGDQEESPIFIPTTTTRRHCASAVGRSLWK